MSGKYAFFPASTSPGDFFGLLKQTGYRWPNDDAVGAGVSGMTSGTTVFAFHFKGGVMVGGDRRATAGSNIMYDRCDKVIPVDDYSLMAIAGVPATAFEMARILSHNFEYFRRSQLQSMSAEGKIRALSTLLKENAGPAIQGLGAVSPIFATFDARQNAPVIFFYDILGAQFQMQTHTATGSGAPMIRGVLEHEDLWGARSLAERDRRGAAILAIRLLHTAARFDSATGQARPEDKIYPVLATITGRGYEFIAEAEMEELFRVAVTEGKHV